MKKLMAIMKIIEFLIGGCLASFLISRHYFNKSVKIEIEDLKNEHDKRLLNILKNVINKMEDENHDIQYSVIDNKDSYTYEDVKNILDEKVNQVLRGRNIQLRQFIDDAIKQIK